MTLVKKLTELSPAASYLNHSRYRNRLRSGQVYNAYKNVVEKAHRFCHRFNSCAVESQHNKRTKYALKRESFRASFDARARLAVLDHNNMGYRVKVRCMRPTGYSPR
jgi:hypothetical protein